MMHIKLLRASYHAVSKSKGVIYSHSDLYGRAAQLCKGMTVEDLVVFKTGNGRGSPLAAVIYEKAV